jgi:hypothetical protein
MQIGWDTLRSLLGNAAHLNWANLLMMEVGGVLLYLAIAKEYAVEPTYGAARGGGPVRHHRRVHAGPRQRALQLLT